MWPHVQILINPEMKTGFSSKAKVLLFEISQIKMEEKNIMSMKFKVHGVRGSVSNSSPEFDRYGGNTSCYEIEIDDCQIVIDTGTGFHNVELMRKQKQSVIIYSHFHHDHIQGLSFNKYLYDNFSPILISSALCNASTLKEILETYYSGHYFPIDLFDQLKHLKIVEFNEINKLLKGKVKLSSTKLRHPGGACGYRFEKNGGSIVTLFDNEYHDNQKQDLIEFCKGADLVVWDGMFTEEELLSKQGWGHSSIERAHEFASLSSLKRMLITHHSPERTDVELDEIGKTLDSNIEFAYENQVFSF